MKKHIILMIIVLLSVLLLKVVGYVIFLVEYAMNVKKGIHCQIRNVLNLIVINRV